ncbi:putative nucleic acid-binding protein [Helianthus anomalus]
MFLRNDQTQHSRRFRCHTWIEKFDLNRGWLYVHCSTCDKTVYPEEDGSLKFVCKDDEDITPKFLYSVNAIITDETTLTEVTFFDKGMTALLKTSCEDLNLKHGYTDP